MPKEAGNAGLSEEVVLGNSRNSSGSPDQQPQFLHWALRGQKEHCGGNKKKKSHFLLKAAGKPFRTASDAFDSSKLP